MSDERYPTWLHENKNHLLCPCTLPRRCTVLTHAVASPEQTLGMSAGSSQKPLQVQLANPATFRGSRKKRRRVSTHGRGELCAVWPIPSLSSDELNTAFGKGKSMVLQDSVRNDGRVAGWESKLETTNRALFVADASSGAAVRARARTISR